MAEEKVFTLAEDQDAEPVVEVVDNDDVFNIGGDDPPYPQEAAAETEIESEEAPPAAAPTFQHSPELIEKAVNALYTVEEIALMSPEALRTAIHGAHRIAQAMVEAGVKKEPAKAGPDDDDDDDGDELSVLDDPERYNQDVVKPIKAILAKQAERLDKLEKENKTLREKHGQNEAKALHSRLMGIATQASPDLPKTFDLKTQAGQAKYAELLQIMEAVHRANQGMQEPKLFERALKAMDLAPEKPAKSTEPPDSPEIGAKKKTWNDAALGGKPNIKKAMTAVDRVGEILSGIRNGKQPVNGVKPAKK